MKTKHWLLFLIPVVGLFLLVIAIVAGVALYYYFGQGDDERNDNQPPVTEVRNETQPQLVFDDEFLESFDPDAPFEQPGHSSPINLHPREDMTITADAGAFEEDVTIRVTDVPTATLEQLDRQMDEAGGMMLFAYDLDAGLGPDSVIPGKYTVTIDMEKHGIPASLYDKFVMYRVASDGRLQPLNVRIKGHFASYQASQNSVTIAGLAFLTVTLGTGTWLVFGKFPAIMNTLRRFHDNNIWPPNWFKWDDTIMLYEKDDFGNFYVCYRYRMTENGSRVQEYLQKKNEIDALVDSIRSAAYWSYVRDHPDALLGNIAERLGLSERHRIAYNELYYKMLAENERVQQLKDDPLLQTPKSVDDIIRSVKVAHRYCRQEQHLKPLSYEYVVWLTPSFEACGQEAYRQKVPFLDPYVVVNYEKVVRNGQYAESYRLPLSVCLTHEVMHVFQVEYMLSSLFKNDRFMEATGALVEHFFARWLMSKDMAPRMTDLKSVQARDIFGFSDRDEKQMLSTALERDNPSYQGVTLPVNTAGYMLGDLLQYLYDHRPYPSVPFTMNTLMIYYGYDHGFLESVRTAFTIREETFFKYYEGFCEEFFEEIDNKQTQYRNAYNEKMLPEVQHKPEQCVMRVSRLGENGTSYGYPYTVRALDVSARPGANGRRLYNLFAVPSEKVLPSEMRFAFFDEKTKKFTEDGLFYDISATGRSPFYCSAALMSRPGSKDLYMGDDYYYDVVAFYQPEAKPSVVGPSEDKRGLLVKVNVTPSAELKEKNYVTGLQVVVKNNKTGRQKTFYALADGMKPQYVARYDLLGITDTTDIDVSLRSRWYYDSPKGGHRYSPYTDPVEYVVKNKTVREVATQDTTIVATGQEEQLVDDMGGQDDGMDVYVHTLSIARVENFSYELRLPSGDEDPKFKAHVTLRDGQFTISMPALHKKSRNGAERYDVWDTPAFIIKGTYQQERPGEVNDIIYRPRDVTLSEGISFTKVKVKINSGEEENRLTFGVNAFKNIDPRIDVDKECHLISFSRGKLNSCSINCPISIKHPRTSNDVDGILCISFNAADPID